MGRALHPCAEDVTAAAALDDPTRRRLYEHIAMQPDAVGRDDAARAIGLARPVAAYHLDRLAEVGLLDVEYRRPNGRGGPGAGRPSKLYRRSSRRVRLSFPPSNEELVARLLLRAADPTGDGSPTSALTAAAREHGAQLGAAARVRAGARPAARRLLKEAAETLSDGGYEPVNDATSVVLHNCPFALVAETHRPLVCGMNLALMEGFVEGLGSQSISPVFDPAPGRCCVVLRSSSASRQP